MLAIHHVYTRTNSYEDTLCCEQKPLFLVFNLIFFVYISISCRGARRSIKDGGGLSALERAMEMGAITDEELFVLLAEGE